MRSQFRPLIEAACARVGWAPRLLEAQVFVESSDDPWAFRYEAAYYQRYLQGHPEAKGYRYGPDAACSRGLLQLLWETTLELGATRGDGAPLAPWDLYDPATNLRVALRYLIKLQTTLGNPPVMAVLSAYNGGLEGNRVPPYRNATYAQKVLTMQERLDG